ncbi:ABC transporter substrate-binding protein [Cryobacterium melibiosiphilum]|uniref:ABC transporter substrate-binding protein n=1 Tax=Cryobacterium melibiosiphilum TaxID=995039 RepID=A0A3A5M9V3_9MICO|nr:ABC transporter substrate-binding protein [Cryobacterium melibiosiphilum]RJT85145.1 ABC transporter substrate-binding protein [Cryobacterium melibiosiphilum]
MSKKRNRSLKSILPIVGTMAVLLTGCSGPAAGSAADGPPPVKVGYFPLAHTASVVNADEEGLFEAQGLDVELIQTGGGAAAITTLVSGSIDITYSNYTSALLAAEKGLPVMLVAANDVGGADHGIFVTSDSAIGTAADLSGKTFAVNNLQNVGTLAVYALLEDAGVDPTDVSLVEMPYPDMQAALERGAVDAIWQVEPFQSGALAAGFVKLSDMFTGTMADIPVAGWVTTKKFAEENPEAISAFQIAISESGEDLQGHRERFVELVPTFTKVPVAVVEQMELPVFESDLNLERLQQTADLLKKYEITKTSVDVNSLVVK